MLGITLFVTGNNFLGHQILCSQCAASGSQENRNTRRESSSVNSEVWLHVHLGGKEIGYGYL